MDKTSKIADAVARAERLLSPRPAAAPSGVTEAPRKKGAPARAPKPPGLLRAAAYGYVTLAARLQELSDPVRLAWQQSVDEARHAREEQVARRQGPGAGRREGAEEERGEQTLRKTAGDAAETAGAASDLAGA